MAQNVDISNDQLPLKGVVLCCTSLTQEVRTRITDAATQMGAVHKLDLTSDVTHLLVGSVATPKYRYVAKERPDIKVLHPDWIEAIRESWTRGDDVDVAALEYKYQPPPFTGLKICVTGFDDLGQRSYISSTVEQQGGTYHGDLTKAVTHLIAAAPKGSKYEHAKLWEIKIVSLKWFEDSLSRGMALEESLYDPNMPVEEQGRDAFRRQARPRTSLGKHGREGGENDAGNGDISKKKLRRTASTRLESQSQDMWQDISSRSINMGHSEVDQWKEDATNSTTHASETTSGAMKLERTVSALPSDTTETSDGLFSGIYILLHGFDRAKAALLQKYLEPNGAHIVRTSTELEDVSSNPLFRARYLLVPHTIPITALLLPEVPAGTVTATEWWVERCVHYKRQMDPSEDVLSRPLWDVNFFGFSDFIVSTTGFVGVDLRQVSEVVKLMGATYQEKVSPSSSVLISGSTSIRKEKAFYANKHHIPVVSAKWLWACLISKERLPFDKFTIQTPSFDPKDFPGEPSMSSPAPTDISQRKADGDSKRKDNRFPKRLSNTRSRHATPSLQMQAAKENPAITTARPQPIVHEDDVDSPLVDGESFSAVTTTELPNRGSQPLQELSPNKSYGRASQTSEQGNENVPIKHESQAKRPSRTASPSKPVSPPKSPRNILQDPIAADIHPPPRSKSEVTAELIGLLNRSNGARPSSGSDAPPLLRRKNRPLGRAPSGISNRSMSASGQPEHLSPASLPEVSESAADGFSAAREEPAPPSTQLGYETPEAEAHRLQMSKKMGTKLQDEGGMKRLASLGTVKDSTLGGDAGVGNRVRARNKTK